MAFTRMYYKIWRRRFRNNLLRLDWYKRRYAKARIRKVTPANVRLAADVEEVLVILGPAIIPTLIDALVDQEVSNYGKEIAVKALVPFNDRRALEPILQLARQSTGRLQNEARRAMAQLCARLAKKGKLPPEYESYARGGVPPKTDLAPPV